MYGGYVYVWSSTGDPFIRLSTALKENEMDEETREAIGQRAVSGATTALAGAGFSPEQESAVAKAIGQAVLEALDEWMNTYYEIEDVDEEYEQ